MNKEDLKIIFIGTPDFAVATLAALLQNGFNVVATITAPDKPAGRGLQLQSSAVKQFAIANNIPVLQPSNLKAPEFISELSGYNANLQIVVAFRMLPEVVWNMPKYGTFNVHASLLPNYRGAAPINWAIINGETETGVSTFKLKHAIDTGNILLQEKVPISPTENAGTLHDKLMTVGAQLMVNTLHKLVNNDLIEQQQEIDTSNANHKHASKIFTADCEINWQLNTKEVFNKIRGLSPHPTAFTYIKDSKNVTKKLKIYVATTINNTTMVAGEWQTDGKTYLHFGCSDGGISILELQLEGKKRMLVQDFLRGITLVS